MSVPSLSANRAVSGPVAADTTMSEAGPRWVDFAIAQLLVVAVLVICVLNLANGHDWGDDFALYISQAKAIVELDTEAVVEANRYALEHSTMNAFSPPIYPWGFPLLLAPVYALWGFDFHVFQVLESVFFAIFVGLLALLVMPRVGRIAGSLMALIVGSSVVYVGWAQSVTSDFPFMTFLALTLVLSDYARRSGMVTRAGNGVLIALGLSAAFASSIRREGVLLFVVIASLQAAEIWSQRRKGSHLQLGALPWRRILLPHMAGLALLALFQAIFPGPPGALYGDSGLHQIGENVTWFSDVFARMVGLMASGSQEPQLWGNESLGSVLLWVLAIAAVAGLIYRMLTEWRKDLGLATYLVLVSLVIGVLPFHEGRYLFTIAPFLIYFAFHGVFAAVGLLAIPLGDRWSGKVAGVMAAVFLAVLAGSNVEQLWDRTEGRLDDGGQVMWGPAHPAALELFATVRTEVPEDEVVGFFRGRAMTFLGERQGLYLTTLEGILEEADWYAMEKNSDYSQYPLTDEEAEAHGIRRVWENEKFVLWKVP